MPDPEGFGEEPQLPLTIDDDESWDAAIWGPKKTLTAEEQAAYDAWFLRKVEAAVHASRRPDAVFYSHEEVMADMSAALERRIVEANRRED